MAAAFQLEMGFHGVMCSLEPVAQLACKLGITLKPIYGCFSNTDRKLVPPTEMTRLGFWQIAEAVK